MVEDAPLTGAGAEQGKAVPIFVLWLAEAAATAAAISDVAMLFLWLNEVVPPPNVQSPVDGEYHQE